MKRVYLKAGMLRSSLLGAAALTVAGVAFAQTADQENPNRYPAAKYVEAIAPAPGETAFNFRLSGYVLGLKMISARYKGVFDDQNYSVYSDLKTSGLAAMLKKQRIWSTTEGRYDSSGMYPLDHTQQNLDKKSRRVEMDYDYASRTIDTSIVPRNGSMGIPPAGPIESFNADDIISAILNMMLTGHAVDGKLCQNDVKVFDSKQHYNLRMVPQETLRYKYDGEKYDGIKCHIYYEPISGFDPEDLPSAKESSTPVVIYFINRPEYGLYMPAKFSYKVSGFKATIKVKDAEIIKG